MTTVTFDTARLAERLRAAGFPPEQAEAVMRAIADAQDELVTKADLNLGLSELKTDLLKWVGAMLVAQAAVVAALVKLLG